MGSKKDSEVHLSAAPSVGLSGSKGIKHCFSREKLLLHAFGLLYKVKSLHAGCIQEHICVSIAKGGACVIFSAKNNKM